MRITIEVPDALSSLSPTASLPSVIATPGAAVSGTVSEAMSGGAAQSSIGGVVAIPDAESAGGAEQSLGEYAVVDARDRANDGGPAPA